MPLHAELPVDLDVFDIVIAGGGTAGCIVASRIADAVPHLSILVLEGGPNGAGNPIIDHPGLFLANIGPDSTTASFYQSSASDSLNGRSVVVPAANVLGGGSSINMMQYSRAQRSDYDEWGMPGWSADELLPHITRVESYYGPGTQHHGHEGPIEVSKGTYSSSRLQDQFVDALGDLGWPELVDLSDMDACNGVQRSLRFVGRDGKRQDTASRYLTPRVKDEEKHSNLHVVVNAQVVKVLTEDDKATGVVFIPRGEKSTSERTIKANKMVIVSAGAFGTPQILERSGVGRADVLEKAGVKQVVDLPGVGKGYEDHNLMLYPFTSTLEPDETMDAVLAGRWDVGKLISENHGILGWNAQEATAKLRPNEDDVAAFTPELKELWNTAYKDHENKPLMMMALVCTYPGEPVGIPAGQYFAISVFTVHPLSRGHLHITGPNLTDAVDFDTGFLSDAKGIDVKKHRWAYKKQREIARRMPVFRGEFAPGHPPFPKDSKAAVVELTADPTRDILNIEYSAEDDALIDSWIRGNVGSAWHSLGTAKMGPRERDGVVDPRTLGVYGIKNLKLADLSIVPSNVAANTGYTAMVLGEKAASIFIDELKAMD